VVFDLFLCAPPHSSKETTAQGAWGAWIRPIACMLYEADVCRHQLAIKMGAGTRTVTPHGRLGGGSDGHKSHAPCATSAPSPQKNHTHARPRSPPGPGRWPRPGPGWAGQRRPRGGGRPPLVCECKGGRKKVCGCHKPPLTRARRRSVPSSFRSRITSLSRALTFLFTNPMSSTPATRPLAAHFLLLAGRAASGGLSGVSGAQGCCRVAAPTAAGTRPTRGAAPFLTTSQGWLAGRLPPPPASALLTTPALGDQRRGFRLRDVSFVGRDRTRRGGE